MHLIDGQAQIQWSVALQLSLCGHLATVLTKCTLQLSLTGYSAEAWANEAWAKVAAKSLTLPSRPQSAALALITQSPFSAVAQMCVRVRACVFIITRAHGSLEVLVTSKALMLREACLWGVHGNSPKQYRCRASAFITSHPWKCFIASGGWAFLGISVVLEERAVLKDGFLCSGDASAS